MKTTLSIITGLSLALVVHLTFAYANWNINPLHWDETTRIMASFGLIFAFACGVAMGVSFYKDKIT